MPPRTRLSASARRVQLLQVGQRVFAAKGVNGTTVEEIAAEAGITKPLIYEHFGGKEGLYRAVIENAKSRLAASLRASVTGDAPTRTRLEQAASALLTFAQDDPDAFRTLVRDAPAPDSGGGKIATIDELSQTLEDLFRAEFERAGHRHPPVRTYAFVMMGSAMLLGEWWLEARPDAEVQELAGALVNMLWNGVGALDPDIRLHHADLSD